MERSFGAYIRTKRLETGMTQKELAGLLHVTESSVSKWERGLSYPDVSMVTSICAALHISEHEFFTACDDDQAHATERAAAVWHGVTLAWRYFFAVSYAAALIPCFICNLVFSGGLTWFWIVLTALALAFCFTNLPFHLRRDRFPLCLGAASGCLLLLLLACWFYVGGHWLAGAIAITAVSLILPWGIWAIWRFVGRYVPPLVLALFSVWLFGLLAVIRLFTGGSWLLGFAYPIAAFCLFYLWLYFAAAYWLPAGPWLKAGLFALLTTFFIPLGNCLSNWMLPDQRTPSLSDYFAWSHLFTQQSVNGFSWVNVLVFALMLLVSILLLAVGAIQEVRRRRT